jgi:nicotinamidase-related amidase
MADALIIVDLQQGFDDPCWGRRNNAACEANIARLVTRWRERGDPVIFVRHDSVEPGSPLAPGTPGNAFKQQLTGEPDLLIVKHVHSAFHGEPDLEAWLREHRVQGVTVAGVQTNMCAETTARVASDLGFEMTFVLDATHSFDLPAVIAEQLTAATAATLAADFGRVVSTNELL